MARSKKRFNKKIFFIILGSVVLVGGVAAGTIIAINTLVKKHAELGMTKAEVLKKLGDPSRTSDSGDTWWYYGGDVGKKYKQIDEYEHSFNEADHIKAESLSLEIEQKHFESRTIKFDSDKKVISYLYDTDTKFDSEKKQISSWNDKQISSLNHDFPENLKCYKVALSKFNLIESQKFTYEAVFSDKSILKEADRNSFVLQGSKSSVSLVWSYSNQIKFDTKIKISAYDARIDIAYDKNAATVKGAGLYNIGDKVVLQADMEPGYFCNGWDTDVRHYLGTRTATHLTDNNYCFITIQEIGIKEYELLSEKAYRIYYILNGGTNSSYNPIYYNEKNSFPLHDATREGYEFDGWYDSNDNRVSYIPEGSSGNITLTAHWSPIHYSISYILDSELYGIATNDPSNPNYYTVENVVTFAPAIREGYTFACWCEWFHGEPIVSTSGRTGNLTLFPTWN